jgi:hypothetical protein
MDTARTHYHAKNSELHVDLHAWDMRVLKGAKHRVDELKKGA